MAPCDITTRSLLRTRTVSILFLYYCIFVFNVTFGNELNDEYAAKQKLREHLLNYNYHEHNHDVFDPSYESNAFRDSDSLIYTTPSFATLHRHYVHKTVFGPVKFLFLVGIEGTGHHLMYAGFPCKQIDRSTIKNIRAFWNGTNLLRISELNNRANSVIEYFIKLKDNALKEIEYNASSTDNKRIIYAIQKQEMFSYPYDFPRNTLRRPDITLLATLCEIARIDCRFVVLRRNMGDVFVSTVIKRRFFKNVLDQIVFLRDNLNAMEEQLKRLDKNFYQLIDFEELTDEKYAPLILNRLEKFIGKKSVLGVNGFINRHKTLSSWRDKIDPDVSEIVCNAFCCEENPFQCTTIWPTIFAETNIAEPDGVPPMHEWYTENMASSTQLFQK